MNKIRKISLASCLVLGIVMGTTSFMIVPETTIDNGLVKVKLYLPDAENGYYRGTRFDWSGVIPSLEYKGHTYHGQWFEKYNPTNHDAIMGPVEEFNPVGYAEAKTGEHFVKIGVGSLLKPDEPSYSSFKFYTISNPGKWTVVKKQRQVQFTHVLDDGEYGYEYQKTVQLTEGKPEMVLLHTLKNTGSRTIETQVYDHNFFVIDRQPTGPDYEVSFPYNHLSAKEGKGIGEVVRLQDNKILFLRNLIKNEQGYFPDLTDGTEVPYEFKVENVKTGAGIKVSCDRPVSKMVFWSNPATVCPEPYMDVKVAPGEEFTWRITYEYYVSDNK